MRHQKSGRKFDRNASSRRAMFRNLAANLILHERIETTEAKAKELRRIAERLVTRAMRLGETAFTPQAGLDAAQKALRLHATRQVGSFVGRFGTRTKPGGETEKIDLVEKVFTDLARRFAGRPGGYTRTIKLGPRRGDGAAMTLIEWVVRPEPQSASVASFAAPAAQAETSGKAPSAEVSPEAKPAKKKKPSAEG